MTVQQKQADTDDSDDALDLSRSEQKAGDGKGGKGVELPLIRKGKQGDKEAEEKDRKQSRRSVRMEDKRISRVRSPHPLTLTNCSKRVRLTQVRMLYAAV